MWLNNDEYCSSAIPYARSPNKTLMPSKPENRFQRSDFELSWADTAYGTNLHKSVIQIYPNDAGID